MRHPPTTRHPRLPFGPAHHCWSCGDAIDPHQAVGGGGVCSRFECRAAEVRRRQAEERRIEARRRALARTRLEEDGAAPDSIRWSLTPFNHAASVPLTPELRAEFLDYLRRTVREAVENRDDDPRAPTPLPREPGTDGSPPAAGDREDAGRFPAPGPGEHRALAVGCATCRGWCCRRGGTHAFLTADRVSRLLRERPDLEPADVPALYASHLEPRHLEGGCVFQGEAGCRLPRLLRSDKCNEYYCPDLLEARRRWRQGSGDGPHHFVAVAPGADDVGGVGTAPAPTDVRRIPPEDGAPPD